MCRLVLLLLLLLQNLLERLQLLHLKKRGCLQMSARTPSLDLGTWNAENLKKPLACEHHRTAVASCVAEAAAANVVLTRRLPAGLMNHHRCAGALGGGRPGVLRMLSIAAEAAVTGVPSKLAYSRWTICQTLSSQKKVRPPHEIPDLPWLPHWPALDLRTQGILQ